MGITSDHFLIHWSVSTQNAWLTKYQTLILNRTTPAWRAVGLRQSPQVAAIQLVVLELIEVHQRRQAGEYTFP